MIKRIMAMLLAAFLLAQPVLAFEFNDGTLNWGDCAHEYDNACDAKCNKCGVQRMVSPHPYAGVVTTPATCNAAGVMTYTCTVCGDGYTEGIAATGAHVYDTPCDGDCNACGTTRTPPHGYADPYDATCDLCGATRDVFPQQSGDVNGDGSVNVRDYGVLQQHLNGFDVSISLETANVNGDGTVNVRDLGLLQQYLNGWDVTLK